MSINYYVGADGATFNIESRAELYEALDILHTQVMDNLPSSSQEDLLPILEAALKSIDEL